MAGTASGACQLLDVPWQSQSGRTMESPQTKHDRYVVETHIPMTQLCIMSTGTGMPGPLLWAPLTTSWRQRNAYLLESVPTVPRIPHCESGPLQATRTCNHTRTPTEPLAATRLGCPEHLNLATAEEIRMNMSINE